VLLNCFLGGIKQNALNQCTDKPCAGGCIVDSFALETLEYVLNTCFSR